MKKQTLSLMVLCVTTSAVATDNPRIVPDAGIIGFSPDNRVCVSEVNRTVLMFNVDDLTSPVIFSESEDGLEGYELGNGNCISNSSVMVFRAGQGASAWCFSQQSGVANGRWYSLNGGITTTMGTPNAVTADGSRVCGGMPGNGQFGQEDVTYVVPCLWDFDGKTFTRTPLDHPTTDYAGLVPQYVTALSISDDGKTIAGQIVSNNGFLCEYVIYQQAADGTWSWFKPFEDQVNPNHLVLPEYPGEGEAIPMAETYLDAEEKAAFDKAMDAYEKGQGEEPDAREYLKNAKGIAAFNAAVERYNNWAKKYNEYDEINHRILMESVSFVFNTGRVSPNGKYLCASNTKSYAEADGSTFDVLHPVLYDIENRKIIDIPLNAPGYTADYAFDVTVTGVSNDGDLIGYERMGDVDFGYVLKHGASQWMPLEEYIIERQPSMAQWIQDNWFHTIETVIDEDEGYVEYADLTISGIPCMSADFSKLATMVYVFWNDGDETLLNRYVSYVIDLDQPASISEITAGADAADSDSWYNLQGIKLTRPAAAGIYINNGRKTFVK
ncbi:MAG: hypothetical protein NC301_01870 [Bacteroides sp.]|nr:hypothetical protein [Bacteroides sp.]MCM1378630.1 hypothetical protein [Bacteroides sp.]MCM1446396.1 hypothetical protein [Prevotella sp.]